MAKTFKNFLKEQKRPTEETRFVGLKMPLSIYKRVKSISEDTNCSVSEVIFEMIKFSLNSDKGGKS